MADACTVTVYLFKSMKKEISYHSPKQYQKNKSREDAPIPRKLPKPKSKYCKKLDGPHLYGAWQQEISSYTNKPTIGFYIRYCVECNRKDTWIAPTLPGIYWELDPDARPPFDD